MRNVFTVPIGGSAASTWTALALPIGPSPLSPATFSADVDASGRYPSRTDVPTEYVSLASWNAFAVDRSAEAVAGRTSIPASAATHNRLFLIRSPLSIDQSSGPPRIVARSTVRVGGG